MYRILNGFVLMKVIMARKKEFIRAQELLSLVVLVLMRKVGLLFWMMKLIRLFLEQMEN
jgi:hypothetical protein